MTLLRQVDDAEAYATLRSPPFDDVLEIADVVPSYRDVVCGTRRAFRTACALPSACLLNGRATSIHLVLPESAGPPSGGCI